MSPKEWFVTWFLLLFNKHNTHTPAYRQAQALAWSLLLSCVSLIISVIALLS